MHHDLTSLANKYGTDKGTQHFKAHGYTEFYAFLFERWQFERFTMLELGLLRGSLSPRSAQRRIATDAPSIKMWLNYFQMANVIGFDTSDFSSLSLERFQFVRGDLSSEPDLVALSALGPFKIIVDDATHAAFHQQAALKVLFKSLEPGGYYVIEDLHWKAGRYSSRLPMTVPTSHLIENLADRRLERLNPCWLQAIGEEVGAVFIHRRSWAGRKNVIKMAIIQKKEIA